MSAGLTSSERALIDAHIASTGVTVCPAQTFSEPTDENPRSLESRLRSKRISERQKKFKKASDRKDYDRKKNLEGFYARRQAKADQRLHEVYALAKEERLSRQEIADKLGVHLRTIDSDIKALVAAGKLEAAEPLADRKVVKRLAAKMTTREIAAKLGLRAKQVSNMLQQMGIHAQSQVGRSVAARRADLVKIAYHHQTYASLAEILGVHYKTIKTDIEALQAAGDLGSWPLEGVGFVYGSIQPLTFVPTAGGRAAQTPFGSLLIQRLDSGGFSVDCTFAHTKCPRFASAGAAEGFLQEFYAARLRQAVAQPDCAKPSELNEVSDE